MNPEHVSEEDYLQLQRAIKNTLGVVADQKKAEIAMILDKNTVASLSGVQRARPLVWHL